MITKMTKTMIRYAGLIIATIPTFQASSAAVVVMLKEATIMVSASKIASAIYAVVVALLSVRHSG
jgi:hypothetical protein